MWRLALPVFWLAPLDVQRRSSRAGCSCCGRKLTTPPSPFDLSASALVVISHASHPRQRHEYRTATPYGADPIDAEGTPVRAARYRPRARLLPYPPSVLPSRKRKKRSRWGTFLGLVTDSGLSSLFFFLFSFFPLFSFWRCGGSSEHPAASGVNSGAQTGWVSDAAERRRAGCSEVRSEVSAQPFSVSLSQRCRHRRDDTCRLLSCHPVVV